MDPTKDAQAALEFVQWFKRVMPMTFERMRQTYYSAFRDEPREIAGRTKGEVINT